MDGRLQEVEVLGPIVPKPVITRKKSHTTSEEERSHAIFYVNPFHLFLPAPDVGGIVDGVLLGLPVAGGIAGGI